MSDLILPQPFERWFAERGWRPRAHQVAMVELASKGVSALLIAPTGGGKTLAGFLPSLIELSQRPAIGPAADSAQLHTLYISPLKALAVDIQRNLEAPIREMGLRVRAETRTGDTPANRRQRQRTRPPDILLTTPESLALLLSYSEAPRYFAELSTVVIDELHALADTKRGHLMALGLARLAAFATKARFVGLSATVAQPEAMARWLDFGNRPVEIVRGAPGAEPQIAIMNPEARVPWGGHMARHTVPDIFNAIKLHKTTLVFVNTRAQAEIVFDDLWRLNDETLPIGLHHGSLAPEQRRKVEAAMAAGKLRAVVATSSLDLGVDWGDVDLVVQVGAPKGASRLLQRIGRANHRLDEASRALLAPGNRFEVLECMAAIEAVHAHELDADAPRPPCLDVLAQHILGCACCGPIEPDALYAEVVRAAPYAELPRADFDAAFRFVLDGGYALAAYDRWRKLQPVGDRHWRAASPLIVRQYRMNVGAIVELPLMKVRLRRGTVLGEVEEAFVQGLTPGDTFIFAGRLLRFEDVDGLSAICSPAKGGGDPKVPAYGGGRLPLSTHLAGRVRDILADPDRHEGFPVEVREWLRMQQYRSVLPRADRVLVEGFPRGGKQFLVAYCFEGRNAHQTLGMLLTRRMERMGLKPLGFVATDYVLGIWGLRPATSPRQHRGAVRRGHAGRRPRGVDGRVLDAASVVPQRRGDRRPDRAQASGPGEDPPAGDVQRRPDLRHAAQARADSHPAAGDAPGCGVATGRRPPPRRACCVARAAGSTTGVSTRVSPLAVPVLLEIGRESVSGEALDELLDEKAQELIAEATGEG